MAKLIVSKFGGTSMGDAGCMLRSSEVAFRQGASLVVVSATSGTTNDLIALGKAAEGQTWPEAGRSAEGQEGLPGHQDQELRGGAGRH